MEANEAQELKEHAEHGAHETAMRPVAFTMSVLIASTWLRRFSKSAS